MRAGGSDDVAVLFGHCKKATGQQRGLLLLRLEIVREDVFAAAAQALHPPSVRVQMHKVRVVKTRWPGYLRERSKGHEHF